ncbi:MAG: hypothetical protein AB1589_45740, partial [Cyanobacteriota bacterium]
TNTIQYYDGGAWVTINAGASDTDTLPEGLVNLYYTDARVSANADVAANTAARHNALTLTTTANGITLDGAQGLTLLAADGANDGFLSSADWTRFDSLDTALAGGLATEYLRGDQTWQTLDTDAVAEGLNQYFTNARVEASVLNGFVGGVNSAIVNTDTVNQAFDKTQGQIDALAAASHPAASLVTLANGITFNPATQVLTVMVADGATDGYLSSGDWTTFNNKQTATLADGSMWVGDGTNTAAAVVMNGEATMDNTGLVTLTNNSVIAKILNAFAVGANATIDATDSILSAFGKAQGQIDAINTNFNENVDDRVAALVQNGTGLNWTYNDVANTFTGDVTLAPFSTTDLVEGANLYFTNA